MKTKREARFIGTRGATSAVDWSCPVMGTTSWDSVSVCRVNGVHGECREGPMGSSAEGDRGEGWQGMVGSDCIIMDHSGSICQKNNSVQRHKQNKRSIFS